MKEYILREDVLNMAIDPIETYLTDEVVCVGDINSIPAADVKEVIHAKWVEKLVYPDGRSSVTEFVCSNCGSKPLESYEVTIYSNFCHFCGAKMEGRIDLEKEEDSHDCSYCKHYEKCYDRDSYYMRMMNLRDGYDDCFER